MSYIQQTLLHLNMVWPLGSYMNYFLHGLIHNFLDSKAEVETVLE